MQENIEKSSKIYQKKVTKVEKKSTEIILIIISQDKSIIIFKCFISYFIELVKIMKESAIDVI